jgi:ABC-type multidrug transport system ATPase subunit
MPLIARNLSVARGGFRLDVPAVTADREGLAIVGRNGSGKTTLLLALQGLIPTDGIVERPGRCAAVFAQPAFLRGSALWNVEVAARDRRRARSFLSDVGLEAAARVEAARLSSGQRQRLALARALAVEPEVLFLDEPFANVDADARVALRRLVREYAAARGCSVIVATQSYADVVALAGRVALLEQGRIETLIGVDALKAHPAPYLRALVREGEPSP